MLPKEGSKYRGKILPKKGLNFAVALLLISAILPSIPLIRDGLRSGGVDWYLGEVNGGSFKGVSDFKAFWGRENTLENIDGSPSESIVTEEIMVREAWIFPSEELKIKTLTPPERIRVKLPVRLVNEAEDDESVQDISVRMEMRGPRNLYASRFYNLSESGMINFDLELEGFGEYVADIYCKLGVKESKARSTMKIIDGINLGGEKFPKKGYDAVVEFANHFEGIYSIESFFYWLSENFDYEVDSPFEAIHSPDNLLSRSADDCDGCATLTACLLQEGLGYDTSILSADTNGDGLLDHAFAVVRCSNSYPDYIRMKYKWDPAFPILPEYGDGEVLFIVDGTRCYPGGDGEEWVTYSECEWYEWIGLIT